MKQYLKLPKKMQHSKFLLFALGIVFAFQAGVAFAAPPTFTAAFSPATVGPGTESTLIYTISSDGQAFENGGFTHNFTDLVLATPSGASSDCDNISLTAPDGGTTLTAANIGIRGTSHSCTISVNVKPTGSTTTETSGDFTSDAGNSGSASATLTVDTGLPGYSISVSPDSVFLGNYSILSININNSGNSSNVSSLTTTITLPTNLPIAPVPSDNIDCAGGAVTAVANSNSFSIDSGAVAAGDTCTASVNVKANQLGEIVVSSLSLLADSVDVGKATTSLTVSAISSAPTFSAAFSPATVGPKTESTLTYTITNPGGVFRNGGFTHNFTNLILATPSGASSNCDSIALTAPDGGTTLSATNISTASSCTISVNIKPTAGTTTETSGDFTSDAGNSGSASATLTVDTGLPGYNITISPDPAGLGDIARLSINIDNGKNVDNVLNLTTTLTLPNSLPLSSVPNESITCTNGAVTADTNSNSFSITSGSVVAGATCAASVDVQASQLGEILVSSSSLQAIINPAAGAVEVGKATTSLTVSDAFAVAVFEPLVVSPGTGSILKFTLTNRDRANTLTNIAFTDDLNDALTGLAASSLPANGFCGGSSTISGSSTLSVTGASLAPEASCSFSIPVTIPGGAIPGSYTNTTSAFTTNSGPKPAASNLLVISAAPLLTMTFVDAMDLTTPVSSVRAGEDLAIKFTLTNSDVSNTASEIGFSLAIDSLIPGVVIKTLPAATSCGAVSTFTSSGSEPTSFVVADAELGGAASCIFDVVLTVPDTAKSGSFTYTSSNVSAVIDSQAASGPGASDNISIVETDFPLAAVLLLITL